MHILISLSIFWFIIELSLYLAWIFVRGLFGKLTGWNRRITHVRSEVKEQLDIQEGRYSGPWRTHFIYHFGRSILDIPNRTNEEKTAWWTRPRTATRTKSIILQLFFSMLSSSPSDSTVSYIFFFLFFFYMFLLERSQLLKPVRMIFDWSTFFCLD